jgi:ubiquinone biosynthesis accessory factor UbiJ
VLGDVSQALAWLPGTVRLRITAAGLLELATASQKPAEMSAPSLNASPATGLTVTVPLPDPLAALRMAVQRQRPEVQIEGDAQLAEAVSWLMKNLRWDIEDDLARWLGTPPTQLLKSVAEQIGQALARLKASASRMGTPGR